MLTILDHIPENLLELHATQLHEALSGPTLIHFEGRQTRPVFVSVLLHGNEDTGWEAIKALLNKYKGNPLPRSLSI
ncbi:MAG: peptidase M14, partial [Gammaproteobacteria bacterium]|nr:peptidase M14 [Gammaproteobacteria bacterium]